MPDDCKSAGAQVPRPSIADYFRSFARAAATGAGSPWAFCAALAFCVGWAAVGPLVSYSEEWQLTINTGTTIITFLTVFLLQNTQNRDSREIHLKLDELLRAEGAARNGFAGLEELSDAELERLQHAFRRLAASCADEVRREPGEGDRPKRSAPTGGSAPTSMNGQDTDRTRKSSAPTASSRS